VSEVSSVPVRVVVEDGVAVIEIDNPPVNALSNSVRAPLLSAIISADESPAIKAIVLHGMGKNFVAGADMREFDLPPHRPFLNDVLLRIEACAKPVVAALHGVVLGGGFELALASHFRVATRDVELGLPEVKLGLLPGSGGTQRLPRLIGPVRALEMMLSGESIRSARAAELRILDHTFEGTDIRASAIRFARELVAKGISPRRLRDESVDATGADSAFFSEQLLKVAKLNRGSTAPECIVRCVEASVTQPFDSALALSRKLFMECRDSVEARALRHLFFAERAAARVEGGASPRAVQKVGVIGSGTMGAGIAISLATTGHDVTLIDTNIEALGAGRERIRTTLDAAVKKGRLTVAAAEQASMRVHAANDLAAASDADLIIEAVFESMSVKQDVFRSLDRICRDGAVLATNTSTLDVDAIARVTRRPQDVVGMHFFSPANIMRLVEIVRGGDTSREAMATARAATKRMGKLGVVVGNCFGFVGNRMLYAAGRENQLLQLEGATPADVDRVLKEFGMAMGPNAVGDLAGLDVGYRVRRERRDLPDDPRYFRVADMLVEAGRLGQKTGRGFFRYEPGSRDALPDIEVDAMIAAEAQRLGIARRDVSDTEIRERYVLALINEGAKLLEEGIASSPGDIDVIWCNGYGFPRYRGGPMFYADSTGLAQILKTIRRFEAEQGDQYWRPAPLLVQLAERGQTFSAWHANKVRH